MGGLELEGREGEDKEIARKCRVRPWPGKILTDSLAVPASAREEPMKCMGSLPR